MTQESHLDSKVTVVVEGVRPADTNNHDSEQTIELQMSPSSSLDEVFTQIEEHGYQPPEFVQRRGISVGRNSLRTVLNPYREIEVVADRSSEPGKYIHEDEPLITFANRGAPEMRIDIVPGAQSQPSGAIKDHNGLVITFHRTVRMPDDGRLHQLPASTGQFPLYNVSEYADRLPDGIVQKKGVFLPMWQREASWMEFECPSDQPYALRVFVGHVNAVSGIRMDERETENDQPLQDYVVLPGQRWLDGICVAPGVVRQFVAMPLGSGYTVEGQKTGKETFGGLQIEIIPRKEHCWFFKSDLVPEDPCLVLSHSRLGIEEHQTPSQLGLVPGTVLCLFGSQPSRTRPFQLSDFQDGDPSVVRLKVSRGPPLRDLDLGVNSKRSSAIGLDIDHMETDSIVVQGAGPSTGSDIWSTIDFIADLSREDPSPTAAPTQPPRTTDLKAMGLAAGGKLVQDIYQDTAPAHIWNTAAARMINIHILDPVSCEAVTHVIPPPPPMDMGQYIKESLPFFVVEEETQDRLEGGDFDNVESVSAMDQRNGVVTEPSLDPSKPTMCLGCQTRLCDCVIRPCGHLFCNACVHELETDRSDRSQGWRCPTCLKGVSHVAGFSAPMNLPGEEYIKTKVPVHVLKIEDGRVQFESILKMRI